MQSRFIKATAAVSAVAATSVALAGGGDTYEVSFSDAAYFNIAAGGIDPASPNYNGQSVTAEAGGPRNDVCSSLVASQLPEQESTRILGSTLPAANIRSH